MPVKNQRFDITAKLVLEVSININAENLADAVEQSKSLHESDFIKFRGEYIDGKINIVGVYKEHPWPSDDEDE